MSGPDQAKWEQLYQLGIQAQAADKTQEAAEQFQAAAQIDDHFADLRFRQGECALALGQTQPAQRHFQAARDLDTLRFRCDSKLNDLIRQGAAQREGEHILLADAERAFAEQSPDGLPGENLFYEHVHLNFDGNYLLARTISAEIEKLLPGWVAARSGTNRPWPSVADCARRLGWSDLDELRGLNIILARSSKAPFTGQLNHEAQMQRLQASIERLAPATQPAGLREAQRICEAAVAAAPDDPVLYGQLAAVKSHTGDLAGAAASLRHELELLPDDSVHWFQLGILLTQEHQFEEAAAAFQHSLQLDPEDVKSLNNLAQSLWSLGRREEAIREFRRMTAMSPDSGLAWIKLGQILEETGRKAAAEDCYRKALAIRSNSEADLLALARFCRSRGWLEAAVTNYDAAIKLKPGDANLRVEAGQNLLTCSVTPRRRIIWRKRCGSTRNRRRHISLYGMAVGQEGKAVEAEKQFREALRIQPDLLEARDKPRHRVDERRAFLRSPLTVRSSSSTKSHEQAGAGIQPGLAQPACSTAGPLTSEQGVDERGHPGARQQDQQPENQKHGNDGHEPPLLVHFEEVPEVAQEAAAGLSRCRFLKLTGWSPAHRDAKSLRLR